MPERGRVGILISGRGSNMIALVTAMRAGRIAADPVIVLSNVPDVEGLARAEALGVPTEVVDHLRIRPRAAHEEKVLEVLRRHRVDLVCLAGYMRLLSPSFVSAYRNRILNVHPALLPAFPGLDAQKQALLHGAKVSGCTVHFVDEECDHGPIVLQAAVPVLENDTVESLSARILREEHRLYPEAVALFFEGRLHPEADRVRIDPAPVR
jgi:phosphoribosylglycinamide formyltransferase-1